MILTKEQVAVLKGATEALFAGQKKIPCVVTVEDLCDSHEELRRELELAKGACIMMAEVSSAFVKERDEARRVAVEQRLRFMPDCESPPDPLRSKRHTAVGMFGLALEDAERLFPEKEGGGR